MKYLDYDKTLNQFLRMTGIPMIEFSYADLLDTAEEYVISHLSESAENLSEIQLSACEYAAAAVAAYDYAFEVCLKDRRVMSDTGEVSLQKENRELIKTASELKKNALKQLTFFGIAELDDFAFLGV